MPAITLPRALLAAGLLASVTACGSSAPPDASGSGATSSAPAARPSARPQPVGAVMPDLMGGNAGRAYEQMNSKLDMVFKDASGQGRPVDDPAEWKICGSQPGPNQQITDFPVVFEVMQVSESCESATPK